MKSRPHYLVVEPLHASPNFRCCLVLSLSELITNNELDKTMGKNQSKLSSDELAELQRNTYCA